MKKSLRAILTASILFGAAQALILSIGTTAVNPRILGPGNILILFAHMFILYFPINLLLAIVCCGTILLNDYRRRAESLTGNLLRLRLFTGMFSIHLCHFFILRFEQAQQIFGRDHYLTTLGIVDLAGLAIMSITFYLGMISIAAPARQGSTGRSSGGYLRLAIAFAVGLLLFLWNRSDERWARIEDLDSEVATATSASSCTLPPTKGVADSSTLKLVLVGLDGLDWRVLLDLVSEGEMPGFCEVLRNGSRGYLDNNGNSYSPIIWSTIYTGMPREVHGIGDFLKFWFFRIPHKISYFPMVAHNDQLFDFKRVVTAFDDYNRMTHISITRREDLLCPPVWSVLKSHGARVLIGGRKNLDEAARLNPGVSKGELEVQRLIADIQMADAEGSDVLIYYSHYLVDDPCHKDWNFPYKGKLFYNPDPEAVREAHYGTLIRNAYLAADRAISILLDSVPNARLIIVSDHGWTFNGYEHFNSPDGVAIFYGEGIAQGREIEGADIYDVFPTMLYLMGMPVPLDAPGKPLIDIMEDPKPVTTVESYSHIAIEAGDETPEDSQELEDLKERMKAMGYL